MFSRARTSSSDNISVGCRRSESSSSARALYDGLLESAVARLRISPGAIHHVSCCCAGPLRHMAIVALIAFSRNMLRIPQPLARATGDETRVVIQSGKGRLERLRPPAVPWSTHRSLGADRQQTKAGRIEHHCLLLARLRHRAKPIRAMDMPVNEVARLEQISISVRNAPKPRCGSPARYGCQAAARVSTSHQVAPVAGQFRSSVAPAPSPQQHLDSVYCSSDS
jgi:hypothetical protein